MRLVIFFCNPIRTLLDLLVLATLLQSVASSPVVTEGASTARQTAANYIHADRQYLIRLSVRQS